MLLRNIAMIEEFGKYIEENNLIKNSDRILLAVSGGIDSMVMTQLFLKTKFQIGIAHCNFSLRGSESDEDESFVRKYAADHLIPFYCKRFDTKGFASEKGFSIQMAARELRFSWFEEIRSKNGYSVIALAHNLNDNIETFLLNLTRGTGIAGLTGIKPKNKYLIHPMLFATRKDITTYCNLNELLFREDKSNAETKYIRNKIRHDVIPLLKEINPSIETTLIETAERLSDINNIYSDFISDIRDKMFYLRGNVIVFKTKELQELFPKKTVLFELFRPYGIGSGQVGDLIDLIDGKTGRQLFTNSHRFLKNRKEILVSQNILSSDFSYVVNSIADLLTVPIVISASFTDITKTFKIPSAKNFACLDSGKIIFPVIFRKWKSGDSFYPLGMTQKKKLSNYFIDNKYSVFEKENCYILESDGKIAWIAGDRIDNRFRITRSSKKALIIEVKRS
jgi:tRNA(Ile)-lysidine synthase